MASLQWTDAYSVKVDAMDAQHRQLFEIVGELSNAMRTGKGKDVAGKVLGRLIEYTVRHFAAEEKLMGDAGYPGLTAHRTEHHALTDQVLAFQRDFEAGIVSITPDLMKFLENWLKDHIQSADRKYGEFISARAPALAKGISVGSA